MTTENREYLCTSLHGVRHALERARADARQLEILGQRLLDEIGAVEGDEHRSKNNLAYQVGQLRRMLGAPPNLSRPPWPRLALCRFMVAMEERLKANDHKPGWQDESYNALASGLGRNFEGLYAELRKLAPAKDRILELTADVANFAMMIADRSCDQGAPRSE